MLCRYAFGDRLIHCGFNGVNAIVNQRVDQAAGGANFAPGHAPDKRPVAGVVLFNASFLLDNLRAVEAKTGFTGDDKVAAQRRGDGHAAEAADGTGNNPDDRGVAAQVDNRGMNIGDGGQTEVGLLQTYAAGFEAQHRLGRDTVAVIFRRQLQRGGHFGAGDFAHTAALEGAFDGNHHRRLAVDRAFGDHHTVVGLRDDALRAEPRRHNAFKRIQQFAVAAVVQQGVGAFASAQFDKAAIVTHERPPQRLVQYEYERRPAWRRSRG